MPRGFIPGDECRKGHMIVGDNMLWVYDHGHKRLRCRECTLVARIRNSEQTARLRKEREEREPERLAKRREATRLRSERARRAKGVKPRKKGCGKHGLPYRQCKECQNRRKREYSRTLGVTVAYDRLLAQDVEAALATKYDDMPSNPANLLAPSPQATPYFHTLTAEFDFARGNCFENTELIDRPDENPPTPEEVAELCAGCPLLTACADYGKNEVPHKRAGVFFGGVLYGPKGRAVSA